MAPDEFDDNPLTPEEALDSDEIRNDDGDEVVDPPDEWIEAKDNETLDERLAEEVPDSLGSDADGEDDVLGTGSICAGNLEIQPQLLAPRQQRDGSPFFADFQPPIERVPNHVGGVARF